MKQFKKRTSVSRQIDQSGKIEQTNKDTVLCFSNDTWFSVLIKARTKRQIQEIFRRNGQIRNYVLFTFSAGISILIRSATSPIPTKNTSTTVTKIVIDLEYSGKDSVIKEIITEIQKSGKKLPEIEFGHVGKESKAHFRAKLVSDKKIKPKITINLKQLLKEIKKTEVGKRLKNA